MSDALEILRNLAEVGLWAFVLFALGAAGVLLANATLFVQVRLGIAKTTLRKFANTPLGEATYIALGDALKHVDEPGDKAVLAVTRLLDTYFLDIIDRMVPGKQNITEEQVSELLTHIVTRLRDAAKPDSPPQP